MSDGISQSPGEVYDSKVHGETCTTCSHTLWVHVSGEHCIAHNRSTSVGCPCKKFSRSTSKRPSWDVYFMEIAKQTATRATCDRKHVGCVLVRERIIIAGGYNGSVRGTPHCDDVGHLMIDGHCERTVHAEANAIAQAAKIGARVDGATAYCTAFPCWPCFRLLVNAGIVRVIYLDAYRPNQVVLDHAKLVGVELQQLASF